MKKLYLVCFSLFILSANLFAQDETLELLTYYPAPYGVYQTINIGIPDHFLVIDYQEGSGNHIYGSTGADNLQISCRPAPPQLVLTTDGRVGINTANPSTTLEITGDLTVTSQSILNTIRAQSIRTTSATIDQDLNVVGTIQCFDITSGGQISAPNILANQASINTASINTQSLSVGAINYTWPNAQGEPNTFLTNDGNGNLSWASAVAGGVTRLNNIAGDVNLVAGANITITPAGQNITIASGGGGGGIVGNGTAGRIPYFSADNTLGDTTLYYSGGELGVGTSPQNTFDVEGNVAIGASYSGNVDAPANGLIVEGNVGIGTTNQAAKLTVRGLGLNPSIPGAVSTGILRIAISDTEAIDIGKMFSSPYSGWIQAGYNGTADPLTLQPLAGNVGIGRDPIVNLLEVNGSVSKTVPGEWLSNSDIRIKTDIQNLTNPIEIINQLRPVKFRYTEDYRIKNPFIEDTYYYNFIAQEFQKVFPDSVSDNGEGFLQMDSYPVTPYLVAAVQELSRAIEDLKKENKILKQEIEKLKVK